MLMYQIDKAQFQHNLILQVHSTYSLEAQLEGLVDGEDKRQLDEDSVELAHAHMGR
jgi:hypothetical protein